MRGLTLLIPLVLTITVPAQSVEPKGHVDDAVITPFAFTHATVHVDARTALQDATILISGGTIKAVGKKVAVPNDAVTIDLHGLHIWPGLIDPYSDYGTAESGTIKGSANGARHWNDALNADVRVHGILKNDLGRSKELRKLGFASVITHRMDGIARGTSAAIALDDGPMPTSIFESDVAAHFSLNKGTSSDAYPGSQMGAIALLRQTFYDAQRYGAAPVHEQSDAVLEAIAKQLKSRLVFEANDRNEVLRWSKVLEEFALPGIIKGKGDEYARLDGIRAMGLPMIIPVDLPDPFDVEDPYDALEVSFARMKHWELAPYNPSLLDSIGIPLAFTLHGRKDTKSFWKDVRRMVACGLDSARAIELLTSAPAQLFGLDDRVGSLREGMRADLLVTTHHLLDPKNTIHETWISGKRFIHSEVSPIDLTGRYNLNLGDGNWTLDVSGAAEKPEAKVRRGSEPDSLFTKATIERNGALISLAFSPKTDPQAIYRLSGTIHRGGLWDGQGQRPGGGWFPWSAIRQAEKSGKTRTDSTRKEPPRRRGMITYPLVGLGWTERPDTHTMVLRHATVWTSNEQGVLRNSDVCIHDGKIIAVGSDLDVAMLFPGKRKPVVLELDATGKHITCGIVDEHSHIAISKGVNEGAQNNTAEVRIGDVVDPDDVNIYRALAGGVTTVQLLHGSANPIGGQSALIKLRWGLDADGLLIDDAPKHIKFALGENVKQSNRRQKTSRFPQTRMGVEQVFYDAFLRAKRYDMEWRAWRSIKPKDRGPQPRRDLELEAIAEILHGERNITCHSYVQSEVAMLLHVSDSMGFHVNTFTHILEGYKQAANIKAHGTNASTFSDWWAYKFEVYDAIPYNAALLHEEGVNTGINSDDAEMCRRLNQEAAKTVKYGGVSEEEAWKMVTLNPAKMLKLDHRIGSIAPGKDADIVVWSENPLSIRAIAEKVFIDGVCYFDKKVDFEKRTWIATERDRLIREMIVAKKSGANTKKPEPEQKKLWHCDDMGDGSEIEQVAP